MQCSWEDCQQNNAMFLWRLYYSIEPAPIHGWWIGLDHNQNCNIHTFIHNLEGILFFSGVINVSSPLFLFLLSKKNSKLVINIYHHYTALVRDMACLLLNYHILFPLTHCLPFLSLRFDWLTAIMSDVKTELNNLRLLLPAAALCLLSLRLRSRMKAVNIQDLVWTLRTWGFSLKYFCFFNSSINKVWIMVDNIVIL